MKVLIIPDKFKGTLTAPAAAEAMAAGWRKARPQDQLDLLPMSDGGDGFGETVSRLLGARRQTVITVNAAHQPHRGYWWWVPAARTAIIESAQIIGLALLPSGKFHPFELDTFGLGAAFRAASRKGALRCLVGIGGSATNDGGFGLARALGWEFLNQDGHPIERWTDLRTLSVLRPPKNARLFREIIVAVDVQNRLLGQRGATRVYGPQKGLEPTDFPLAERCLNQLRLISEAYRKRPLAREPGTGAAGGLGFGLRCYLGARLRPGFDLFARYAELSRRLKSVQLVLTGEGAIDRSTLMGKGVGEIARHCQKARIPCFGLAGILGDLSIVQRRFSQVQSMAPLLTSPETARSNPAFWLQKLTETVALGYSRNR
jgi:glycerate 2-kinase